MRVFEAMSELIRRSDLRVIFGVFGSSNVAWVGYGVERGDLQWVRTRHEETALTAAVAYARVSGKVGLATTTLGPGFANTVNALAAAVHSHVPVILVVGQSPSNKMGGDFQNLNQRQIVAAIGAGFHSASRADEVESAYWAAWDAARWNGLPQVLSIDEAILSDSMDLSDRTGPVEREIQTPDSESVSAAVDVLCAAEAPLLLAGQGALLAECHDELLELADLIGARLASTLSVNRYFAGDARDLGVCGKSSPPIVAEELAATDAVVAVGASLNSFTTSDGHIFPAAKIIQCEIDAEQEFRASSAELGLLGDGRACVRALIDEWKRRGLAARPNTQRLLTRADLAASVMAANLDHDPARGLDLRHVYSHFDSTLPKDRIIVTDGGRASLPAPTLLDARDRRSWIPSRGYGSVGLGIGAAIGAAVAEPTRKVVLFCGDGGFMMSAQELDTIRLHNLDITIVIMDDAQYGSEIKYLVRHGLTLDVARQSLPDIPVLASAFGGVGVVVRTPAELAGVTIDSAGMLIVDARIDPEVDPANI